MLFVLLALATAVVSGKVCVDCCDQNKNVWYLFLYSFMSIVDVLFIPTLSDWSASTLVESRLEVSTAHYAMILGCWLSIAGHELHSIYTGAAGDRDRSAMIGHHIVTITAICLSYYFDYTVIGSVIMYIHDISDVPVIILKLCAHNDVADRVLIPVYVVTLLTWVYARLYLFGWIAFGTMSVVATGDHGIVPIVCGSCLLVLWCLHCYWFSLLISLGVKNLGGGDGSGQRLVEDYQS
jgi:hypothetical protein